MTIVVTPLSRSALFGRVLVAHFVGLLTVSVYGARGTSSMFSAAIAALFIGGMVSIPWCALLTVVIWACGGWLARHLIALCLIGPILVCASWFVLFGAGLLDVVFVSCAAASLTVATISAVASLRRTAAS